MSKPNTSPTQAMTKPDSRPVNPDFSSGPCAKRPGWSVAALKNALTGRSHRSAPGKERLARVIAKHRDLLNIPQDYRIAIVPGSDTGAVEMALWSLLGPRPVDVLAWESFGKGWLTDITAQLKLDQVNSLTAPYGALPELSTVNPAHDVVFTWNGTTAGVRVPDGDWIADNRAGLTICDATSAVFAYDLPWQKLDVTTWSWQKVLGGEAAHGMLVLSPRAVARLESYTPPRPLPKLFRMTKKGKLNEALFEGSTINTPSMIAVEDCLDALRWVKEIGGLTATIKRSRNNYDMIANWVEKTAWVDFLAEEPATRSTTSICLKIIDPWFEALDGPTQKAFIKAMTAVLAEEEAGYDLGAYRDAPPGLRIWGGATVEESDMAALLPWLDWAYESQKQKQATKIKTQEG